MKELGSLHINKVTTQNVVSCPLRSVSVFASVLFESVLAI